MNADEFERALGLGEDSVEVVSLLGKLGVTKKLKLGKEGSVRLALHEKGLMLVFVPEAPKSSKVKLNGVHFYSNDYDEDFVTFAGDLPRGLAYSDSRVAVLKKLGQPTKSILDAGLEHWMAGGRRLTVGYIGEGERVGWVQIGFPVVP